MGECTSARTRSRKGVWSYRQHLVLGVAIIEEGGTLRFLEHKPTTFSKRQVHRIGSALRNGEEIDEELYRRILIHQSALCDHLEILAASTLSELGVPLERSTDSVVEPDSNRFFYRLKGQDPAGAR